MTTYNDGEEKMRFVAQFDEAGAEVGHSAAIGRTTVQVSFECKYDSHGNWTDCVQWVTAEGQRRMNERWTRAITYR
jgi:hypothetical protein